MKPIDHYTTLSEEAQTEIKSATYFMKLNLIICCVNSLQVEIEAYPKLFSGSLADELILLNPNQILGLVKALADQCQETLIAK